MSFEINLYPPQCFSEIGKKETNEDYIIPSENCAVGDRNAFFCCDGVGGFPFGEIHYFFMEDGRFAILLFKLKILSVFITGK